MGPASSEMTVQDSYPDPLIMIPSSLNPILPVLSRCVGVARSLALVARTVHLAERSLAYHVAYALMRDY